MEQQGFTTISNDEYFKLRSVYEILQNDSKNMIQIYDSEFRENIIYIHNEKSVLNKFSNLHEKIDELKFKITELKEQIKKLNEGTD